jgi:hypothetical protein
MRGGKGKQIKKNAMTISILISTMYGFRKPNYFVSVVDFLKKQIEAIKIDAKITTLGRHNAEYEAYHRDFVDKKYLETYEVKEVEQWINGHIDTLADDDYLCIYHDDLFIDYTGWLPTFVNTYERKELNCGTLGIVSHSNSIIKHVGGLLFKCLYANGALFISGKNARAKFCLEYRHEKTDTDFCYEQVYRGRTNYLVALPHRHYMVPYKETYKYDAQWEKEIYADRKHFFNKWNAKMSYYVK